MFEQIVLLLTTAGAACSGWLTVILIATGSLTFVTGCIAISLAVRHLLDPIVGGSAVGGAGSDTVKRLPGKTQRSSRRKK